MHAQTITPPSEMVKPFLDLVVAYGIAGLAFGITLAWVFLLFRFDRRLALSLSGAALLIAALAFLADQLGWLSDTKVFPPRFVLMEAPILILIITLGLSRFGKKMAAQMPVSSLIALQVFRLPLELLMLRAALLQVMPVEFSLLGYNFDVLTGLGAMLLLLYRGAFGELKLAVVKAWNLFGIACLVVIACLALATTPQIHAFGADPVHVNTWILHFPYSLLPMMLVSFALLGHLVLSRKLYALQAVTSPHFFPLHSRNSISHIPATSSKP